MMKKTGFSLLVLTLLPFCTLISCGPESTDSKSSSGEPSEAPNTGNRFLDAAIQKVSAANPELSLDQSRKVVESMTAGGAIGLGEVNSMNLEDLSQNADRLNAAYEKGLSEVK